MAKKLEFQSSFTSGILSPRLWAAVDFNKYKNGLKDAVNCKVFPQGAIQKRQGSQYIATCKQGGSNKVRLLRFQFAQSNAYILEFGLNYIRFYKNGAQILSGGLPYELSTPYSDTDVWNISYAQYGNTIYLANGSFPVYKLLWEADTNWTLSQVLFFPPMTYEPGFAPATTLTPSATTGTGINFTTGSSTFLAADVGRNLVVLDSNGNILQNSGQAVIRSITSTTVVVADILTPFLSTSAIASGAWKMDLSPYSQLQPSGAADGTSITINSFIAGSAGQITPNANLTPGATTGSGITFAADQAGTFNSSNIGQLLLNLIAPGAATITSITDSQHAVATITTTWASTGQIAATDWAIAAPIATFRNADVGNYIVLQNGLVQITAVNSSSQVVANVQKALSAISNTVEWSLETPDWTNTRGYPSIVAFNQQRLMLASWTASPQTVTFSKTGVFEDFGIGSTDDDAISVNISTNNVNTINWALPIRLDMVLGSSGAEVSLNGGGNAITPSNIQQITRSYYGSNFQQSIVLGIEGLYFQRSSRKIMSIRYDFLSDTYISDDLTFLAEHITAGLIKEIAWAHDPDRQIYAVLKDGTIICATYYKEQQVIAWTRFTTNGLYESVQTISTGQYDEVWVVVNRTINGSVTRYIERFDTSDGTHYLDGYSDCFGIYSAPITIQNITNANPCVVTANSHGFSNGDQIKFANNTFGTTNWIDGHTFTVSNVTTNTFNLIDTYGELGAIGSTVNSTTLDEVDTYGTVGKLVTTISALDYLDGQIVQVKADGAVQNNKTVVAGSITLDSPARDIVVGIPYTMTIQTLNREYNLGEGSQQGQQVRWVRPIVRLYNSSLPILNGNFKASRTPQMNTDSPVQLYSGDIVYGGLTWDATGILTLTSTYPLPVVILGIFGSLEGGMQ